MATRFVKFLSPRDTGSCVDDVWVNPANVIAVEVEDDGYTHLIVSGGTIPVTGTPGSAIASLEKSAQ